MDRAKVCFERYREVMGALSVDATFGRLTLFYTPNWGLNLGDIVGDEGIILH